jgi:hypothetical protein
VSCVWAAQTGVYLPEIRKIVGAGSAVHTAVRNAAGPRGLVPSPCGCSLLAHNDSHNSASGPLLSVMPATLLSAPYALMNWLAHPEIVGSSEKFVWPLEAIFAIFFAFHWPTLCVHYCFINALNFLCTDLHGRNSVHFFLAFLWCLACGVPGLGKPNSMRCNIITNDGLQPNPFNLLAFTVHIMHKHAAHRHQNSACSFTRLDNLVFMHCS